VQTDKVKIIDAQNIKKYYDGGKVKALDGVSLEVDKGDFICIIV